MASVVCVWHGCYFAQSASQGLQGAWTRETSSWQVTNTRSQMRHTPHAGESLWFLASDWLPNGSWARGSVPGGSGTVSLRFNFSVKTWKICYYAMQSATYCIPISLGKYIVEQIMHPLAFNRISLNQMKAHKIIDVPDALIHFASINCFYWQRIIWNTQKLFSKGEEW